jgi:hypothetical protein
MTRLDSIDLCQVESMSRRGKQWKGGDIGSWTGSIDKIDCDRSHLPPAPYPTGYFPHDNDVMMMLCLSWIPFPFLLRNDLSLISLDSMNWSSFA